MLKKVKNETELFDYVNWYNNFRIEIFDEKIINYGFKKHIFELKKIKSL